MDDKLKEWQASQSYRYIGRDGKPVLARDLEDRAERAEAQLAAMTAERDSMKAEWDKSFELMNKAGDFLKQALAERDALVGAAYEASAEWCRKNERHGSIPAYNILRLTPADATAALDHMLAQAKAEGMRKAAKEAGRYLTVADAQEAILAAAQKEAGK